VPESPDRDRPAGRLRGPGGTWANLRLYIARQAASPGRYVLEQLLFALVGWVPTVLGIGLRALLYRLILHMEGVAAIEKNVRLRFASYFQLGRGAYIDEGVYIHACPGGVQIGEGRLIRCDASQELQISRVRKTLEWLQGLRIGEALGSVALSYWEGRMTTAPRAIAASRC